MLTAKDNLRMIEHIQQLIHKIQAGGKCNGVNGIKSLKQLLPCDSVRLLVPHLHYVKFAASLFVWCRFFFFVYQKKQIQVIVH